jgi:hypothetical protein
VVLIGTLCAGAGISGVGSGHAIAHFKIWMYTLVMVEP